MRRILTAVSLICAATAVTADTPEILKVTATDDGSSWSFAVTLRHKDTGNDHFADSWTIYTKSGTKIATRVLAHPHVNEQPFTRSLSGVKLPAGTNHVFIRPHDSVHGDGPEFKVGLKKPATEPTDQM